LFNKTFKKIFNEEEKKKERIDNALPKIIKTRFQTPSLMKYMVKMRKEYIYKLRQSEHQKDSFETHNWLPYQYYRFFVRFFYFSINSGNKK